jgi:nitroimidazol reductase NimA-like FMN-containing flavoprotein (pyridoxamine 5'-phosphate oxidase superfamily)
VRRRDKEVTDPGEVLDVLARGEVLRLALVDDGAPYVVPLSFAALPGRWGSPLEGLRLFVHSAPHGRKIEALRKDPRVCFEVTVDVAVVRAERACAFGVRYRSVIGEGRAGFLLDPAARARALSLIAERYGATPAPLPEDELAKVVVVEIAVDALTCKVSPPPRR